MSSIFQDDKLIAQLIKSAVDHEVKFNKNGQLAADPAVNVEYRNYLDTTKKLADQLEQVYSPTAQTGPAVSASQEAPVGVTQLASLGNFLDYIVANQISVDGQRVAYGANEQNPDQRKWLPVTAEQIKFMQESMTPEGQRAPFKADYYVNPTLLTQYVNALLQQVSGQSQATQTFAKAMLGKLVTRINNIFNTQLSTEYKAPEAQVADTTQVDTIPQLLDPQNWGQTGTVPVTIGDLKSVDALEAVLRKFRVALKVGDKTATIEDLQNFNLCAVMNILNDRAQAIGRGSQRPAARAYMVQIAQLASQANCQLTGPSGATPATSAGGGATGRTNAALQVVSSLRPFNSQYISFNEISQFLKNYLLLQPDAATLVEQVNNSINDANSKMSSPGASILMDNLTSGKVKAMVKDPVGGAVPFIDDLYTIISVAGRLYLDFFTRFKNGLEPQVAASVEQQITSGGPVQTNLSDLMSVRETLMNERSR